MPFDGEGNRRVAQDAEIVGIVGVLPDVFSVEHEVSSKSLLQAGMKLIAESGPEGRRDARHKRRDYRGVATIVREDEVFIEWSFERSCIGEAQHRAGPLD